ncbi:hypothetical protein [Pseudomonas sp. PB106]|uniref:hypothetical protein n=1 Tax=Pseudomonas sp. PB106 TaxID=2494699 RepID=UPI0021138EE1|nr:hypothetical protein [Pseudomonas sp. PB106]
MNTQLSTHALAELYKKAAPSGAAFAFVGFNISRLRQRVQLIAVKFEDHLSSGDPRTMKRDIYSELMDGLDALSKERQDKISLKKTRVKRIGAMKGKLTLPEEFDASLTHSLLDAFER